MYVIHIPVTFYIYKYDILYIYIISYIPLAANRSPPTEGRASRFAPMIEKPSGWGREEVQHHNLSKKGGFATMLVLVFSVG